MTTRYARPKEGDLIARFRTKGLKVSKTIISIDKLMPKLTDEDIHTLHREVALYMLTHNDLDPEYRRYLLKQFDSCPCCQTWLGHNNPPADDEPEPPYRQQTSFKFDR